MSRPNIVVADHAGFCYGVESAIKKIQKQLGTHNNVYTMSEVVHNQRVNDDLKQEGLHFEPDRDKIPDDSLVVLRTHGVPQETYDYFSKRGIPCLDVTCPFVSKTHRLIANLDENEDVLLYTGTPGHAEASAALSYAKCPVFLVSSAEQLEEVIKDNPELFQKRHVVLLSQTTFQLSEWQKCLKIVNSLCTNPSIFGTICKATEERQYEAEVLSKRCDRMIVIGGKHSSNTIKLYDVCRKNCETCLVETADELNPHFFDGQINTIGVTAGASTPSATIKEVLKAMSEEVENKKVADEGEQSFAEMLEENLSHMSNDQRVKGVIVGVTPTDIQVDIGRKQTGYIKYDEWSYDPTVDPAKEAKVGDEVNCVIMKTNDAEGTIMLSKRRFDSANAWSELEEANESGEILEGTVTDINKGGVIATTDKGIRVFIPGSLATASRGEPLENLRNQKVRFKIIEVNKQRKRAVGSIKAVLKEERKEAREKFWATAEVGQKYTGVVKSLTSYGAFVDIGGVDGMIHISELSWKRIKHPSEVVKVGDTVEVYIKSLDNNRISLGYKKDEDNPWVILKNTYDVGDVVDCKIVGLTAFGAFANIIPGIDGLIHISQIADERIEKPDDVLSEGEIVKAKITEIDYDKKRVSLSIRALLDDGEYTEDEVYNVVPEDEDADEAPADEEAEADEAPADEDAE